MLPFGSRCFTAKSNAALKLRVCTQVISLAPGSMAYSERSTAPSGSVASHWTVADQVVGCVSEVSIVLPRIVTIGNRFGPRASMDADFPQDWEPIASARAP